MRVKIVWGTLLLAVLAVVLALAFVPAPENWGVGESSFSYFLGTSVMAAVLHTGAGLLFVSSLSVYKTKLRTAYICIASSAVLIALGTLQWPLLSAFGLWETAWVEKGGVALPFLGAGIGAYVGARLIGKLVNVRTILMNPWVVMLGMAVAIAIVSLLPRAAHNIDEIAFDMSNAVLVITGFFITAAGLIVFRVKRQIGAHYVNAMAWLVVAFMGGAVILLVVTIDAFLTASEQDLMNKVINALTIATGLIWSRAGFAFAKSKDY